MRYLILAQSDVTARALGAWLELLGERPLPDQEGKGLDDGRVLCAVDPGSLPGGFVEGFRRMAMRLEGEALATLDGRITVLADSVRVSDLNAVGAPGGWDRLLALLILAFPDVRFVFGVASGLTDKERAKWNARHGLASLFGPTHSPLFDGLGLRARVRRITAEHEVTNDENGKLKVAGWIPQRKQWAVAIDDEPMYAYLHAYVAYRHGYRAFAVHSMELGDALLKGVEANNTGWNLSTPKLALEDYYLGFPDKEENLKFEHQSLHLARLEERTKYWCRLGSGDLVRHFITSGHGRSQGPENVHDNREFRRKLRLAGRGGREVTKPTAGLFPLWRQLGLDRSLKWSDSKGKVRRGLAEGFVWPAEDSSERGEPTGGHSAPGLLLLVAEALIARAEARIDSVSTVKDAVTGAVLATTAHELLGPKTPTTAREALELKHRFEVLAECQFGGIDHNLSPEDRFAEIRRDMRLLGRWYGLRARESAVLNGELTIVGRISRIFREFEEFDEEEKCRRRMRTLHRRIWWRQSRKNPAAWIVWPLRAYIEFLLGSNTRFTVAIIAWIAGLTITFKLLEQLALPEEQDSSIWGFSQAISFFFGTEALNSSHPAWVFFTVLATVSGFVHLGVFISQVYATIARR